MIHAAPSTQAFIIFGGIRLQRADYEWNTLTARLAGDAERARVHGQILLLLFGWRTEFVQQSSLSVRRKGEVPCWRALMKVLLESGVYADPVLQGASSSKRLHTRVRSWRLNRHLDAVREEKHAEKGLSRRGASASVPKSNFLFIKSILACRAIIVY